MKQVCAKYKAKYVGKADFIHFMHWLGTWLVVPVTYNLEKV